MRLAPQVAALWQAAAGVLDVPDLGTTSQFAARYRRLKPGTTERPGLWSNDHFPCLTDVMDVTDEALALGKRGVVGMKGAQVGGSEAFLNALAKLKACYSGPILYLISKDEVAREFSRERFAYIMDTCEPVRKKALRGKTEGEMVLHKRFTDGKVDFAGGRSVLNLQSQPYRFVFIDEVDSLADEVPGLGDPLRIAETRVDSFSGDKLILAFGHPTVGAHGVAQLYYDLSDQRRGFVACPHCAHEFWLDWHACVKAVASDGLTAAQAQFDPRCYVMFCPGCGTILSEADRLRMIRHVRQRSTLEPEEAARRQWIGVHISQLYSPQIALRELAGYYVDALKSNNLRVFVNMRLGDKFEPQVRKIESDALRRCIVSPGREDPALKRDPHCYDCGQVPPGVRFLTLGQDSRETELHWAVWGFGMRRHADHGHPEICGWLIDRGVFERAKSPVLDASELHVFDALYWRQWPTTYDDKRFLQIRLGAHDIGWSNRRGDDNDKRNVIAVNEYCRQMFPLARPARGAALDMSSASRADLVRAGNPERYLYRGESVADERVRPLLLNTFLLKEHFFGLVAKRIPVAVCGTGAPAGAPSAVPAVPLKTQNSELITSVPPLSVREFTRITFPRDVGDRFLRELGAEELQAVGRKGELAWVRKGPNHFLDCTIMAFGAAIHENLFTDGLTFEEAEARAQVAPARTAPKGYYPGVDEE